MQTSDTRDPRTPKVARAGVEAVTDTRPEAAAPTTETTTERPWWAADPAELAREKDWLNNPLPRLWRRISGPQRLR